MDNFYIAPSSDLILLKVPIQIDERNQLDFATLTDQYNYFYGLSNKIEAEKFTYIREDSVIRFEACIDDIIEYNYVMYRNSSFSNKWFYAFIENMEYKNDSLTNIKIKEDSFQTWMFDIELKPSFIERKHTTDDRIGANLKDEGLETGEYMINTISSSSSLEYVGIVTATEDIFSVLTGTKKSYSSAWGEPCFLGGVPSGLYMWAFPLTKFSQYTGEDFTLDSVLEYFAKEGKSDEINSVYVAPKNCLDFDGGSWSVLYYNTVTGKWGTQAPTPEDKRLYYFDKFKTFSEQVVINKPITIDGYTPRNNKLLTGNYNYLLVDNNNGASAKFDYELFYGSVSCNFNIYCVPTPSGSIRAIPLYYNYGGTENNLAGINGGKLPIGAWANDVYTNWLTQNGVNVFGLKLNAKEAGIVGGSLQIGTGLIGGLLGNPVGFMGAIGGIGDIQDTMKENYRRSLAPMQSEGNTNCGDVAFATGHTNFVFYQMCVRHQYAESIDSFFDMFGYKFNILETPLLHTRTYWNYIKTRGLNVLADIPQKSLENIKRMFDNGLTIWHNPTYFLDYSRNNTILEEYLPE